MTLPTTTMISVEDQNGMPIALSLGTLSGSTAYDTHSVTAIGTINTSRITIGNLKIGTYTVGQKIPTALGADADNTLLDIAAVAAALMISLWILAGGVWNDVGVWQDTAVWVD